VPVINQKGGSGKTTTATNLAAVWGRERQRPTLLVDLDPQFAATRHLGVRPADVSATLFDVLADCDCQHGCSVRLSCWAWS